MYGWECASDGAGHTQRCAHLGEPGASERHLTPAIERLHNASVGTRKKIEERPARYFALAALSSGPIPIFGWECGGWCVAERHTQSAVGEPRVASVLTAALERLHNASGCTRRKIDERPRGYFALAALKCDRAEVGVYTQH